jgi:hypothetical protein
MTIVELMIGSTLSVLLMGTILLSIFLLKNAQYQYQTNVELTQNTRVVMEQMIWGIIEQGQANRRGIIEAVSATVSPGQIDYTDTNAVVHSIRQNNGNIEYRRGAAGMWTTLLDPNGQLAFDPAQYSTSLSFAQTNPRAVTINLTLGKNIRGRWHYASLSTQVAFRNS